MSIDNRYTMWATVLYPDSMPSNWKDIITSWFMPVCVSPLHDRDLNADNSPKKPHYHLLIDFGRLKKSRQQVESFFSQINGVGAEPIGSKRGYTRYLCHLDNPDKFQYSQDDILQFGGYDFFSVISSAGSRYTLMRQIIRWCNQYNCYDFSQLVEYAEEYNPEWFSLLCDGSTGMIKEYMKSKTWRISRARENVGKPSK